MNELIKSNPFRLGFGLMRLPKLSDGSIDIPQVCEMADRFLAAGGTYFDTAYVYDKAWSAPGQGTSIITSCTPSSAPTSTSTINTACGTL